MDTIFALFSLLLPPNSMSMATKSWWNLSSEEEQVHIRTQSYLKEDLRLL